MKATDVDHIIAHRGDPKLFWDQSNWRALCHSCHSREFIEQYVKDSYDLRPAAIIERLGLKDFDYNLVSEYGHFGKDGLPWEE